MAEPAADLSQGPVLLSFSLATASFALATTVVRFYVRRGIHGGFGVDDYTSGVATVIALIATIFGILEGTAPEGSRALQFNVIGQPWYLVSVTLSKISICFFFMDLLRRARQWRVLLAGLIVLMAAINLAFALVVYLQCQPLEKAWNPSVAGSCSDPKIQVNFGYAQGAFSVFSWVFLALFPMLIIRDIARGGEPAWPLYTTAALSFVSGIFVIVRTAQTSQTTGATLYTIHFFYASLMANLEQNLALTSSNLLTLGALFSPTTTALTTTSTTSTTTTRRSTRKRRRRDPYGSASSAGTRHSAKSAGKRVLTSAGTNYSTRGRGGGGGVGGAGGGGSVSSLRSITRPDTAESGRASSRGSSRGSSARREGGPLGGGAGENIERKRSTHLIIEGPGLRGDGRGVVVEEYDLGEGRGGGGGYYSSSEGEGGDMGGYGSDDGGSDIDLEAWPRGIIKTVSVEVVEEVNEEYVAAAAAAAAAATAAALRGEGNANAGGDKAVVGSSGKGVGRNSVMVMPGVVGVRQPRGGVGVGGESADRVSGGSVIEQDWETMLRAGPPR